METLLSSDGSNCFRCHDGPFGHLSLSGIVASYFAFFMLHAIISVVADST